MVTKWTADLQSFTRISKQ